MDYLKVYTRFRKDISALSDAEKGRLFDAMLKYAEDGIAPQLTGSERIMWPVAQQNIDYARKESDKQAENGGKGGRPKKATETQQNPDKPTETQTNPTKAYNNNINVNVKEKDIGSSSNNAHAQGQFPEQDDEIEDAQAAGTPEWVDMLTLYGIKMSTGAWQEMRELQEEGIGSDLICWAVEQAVNAGACNWNYLKKVLDNCARLGCKTRARAEELAAIRKAEKEKPKETPIRKAPAYNPQPQQPKKVSAQNYEQRSYSDSFIAGFDDDIMAEARALHAQRARESA